MSFRTRVNGALTGAFLFTLGAPALAIRMYREGALHKLDSAQAIAVAGSSTLPLMIICLLIVSMYPLLGWVSILVTLGIACALGAAFGAVMFDLSEAAPLGSPGNPRPMPETSEDLVYYVNKNRSGSPDVVTRSREGEISLADLKTSFDASRRTDCVVSMINSWPPSSPSDPYMCDACDGEGRVTREDRLGTEQCQECGGNGQHWSWFR